MSSATAQQIRELLEHDLLHAGMLSQLLGEAQGSLRETEDRIRTLLRELLEGDEVQIGNTTLRDPEYVAFTAWSGTISERVDRAFGEVGRHEGQGEAFAYWLCLTRNVDTFEGVEP